MNYLFDTNIIIGFLKNEETIISKISKISVLNIAVITVGEMLFGACNSNNVKNNISLYNEFFKCCNILDISEETASYYAEIRCKLKKKGKPIPENDIWIAAVAKENNMVIVTRDRHLNGIDFIQTVEW